MESQFRKSALMLEEKDPRVAAPPQGGAARATCPAGKARRCIETLQVATPPHGGVARATCPAGNAFALISTLLDMHATLADSP